METSIGFLLLFQVILIALNAIFASAEIAVLSANEAKLERMAAQGNRKAKRLCRLTSQPAKFLATIQVAITLSGFLGSAFAADHFSDPLVDWLLALGLSIPRATLDAIAVVVITLTLSYFTLVFGELVPKRVAMKKAESLALGISGLVGGIAAVFKPVVWFLSLSTNAVLRLMGIDPHQEDDPVSEEEIRLMVDAGSQKGTIDQEEREFIQNVFAFDDLTAEEIATHRTGVVGLWMEEDMAAWDETIHQTRHTRYPVFGDSSDQVLGILNAKDYFRLKAPTREAVMAEAVKPPYFVPETIKADVLFRNMKKERVTLAVVMDEYGGMVGIVTINDLVEELVGEFSEEMPARSRRSPRIVTVSENVWVIHGSVELEELEKVTGLPLVRDNCDTFTGLVFDALGQIPPDGRQDISLDLEELHIQVSLIRDHQIEKAEIRRKTGTKE